MELLPTNKRIIESYDQETDRYLNSFFLLNKRAPVIDGLWKVKLSMVWAKEIKEHIEAKLWLQMEELVNYKEKFWYELKIDGKAQISVTRERKWRYNEGTMHITLYRYSMKDIFRENFRLYKNESIREKYKQDTIQIWEILEKRRWMKDVLLEEIKRKDEYDRHIDSLPSEIKYMLK